MLFLRGTGSAPICYRVQRADKPRFVGFGLTVSTCADLEKLSHLPNATAIGPSSMPGGGKILALTDPSAFRVEVICGQADAEPLPHRAPLDWNEAGNILRINAGQRPPVAPPEVLRLGHVVLEVADFQSTCSWYTRHLGFIPSDI